MSSEAQLILRLEARTKKFERDLKKAIDKLEGNVKRGNKKWDAGMNRMERRAKKFSKNVARTLGSVSGVGTLGIGAAFTISAKTIADFRQSMSTVKAVTGATSSEFAELEDKARQLGATTRFSASQAADGMVALGRAGFDTKQVMASIEGTLLLAQSGALELGSAADIASNVLQGFRLDASEAGRAVDVLSLAANSSNTNVEQLGQALSFVAPASASVGVSLEETSAAISALSDAGIQATRAGTGLRHILIQLASNGVDLSEEAGGLQGALKNLATQNIDLAKASELVGNRQAASLLVLLDSVDKIGTLETAYESAAGSAARTAAIMDDNLNGALLATKSRLQELAIAMGEAGGEQALINGLENLQDLLTFVAENADTFHKALIVLAASAAGLISAKAIGGVLTALGAARASFLATAATANVATVSMKGLSLGVKALLVSLGPVGWVAIAAGAIAAFVQFGGAADNAAQKIENFDKTLADLNKTNKVLQQDTKRLEELTQDLAAANVEIGDAATAAMLLEVNALNTRIAKNKELAEVYKTLLRAQATSGQSAVNEIERKKNKLTFVRTHQRSGQGNSRRLVSVDEEKRLKQEGFNKLLEEANERATNGLKLTKKQSKALELQIEHAEALAKVEAARAQLKDLDAPAPVEVPVTAKVEKVIAPPRAEEPKVDKALERQLEVIAALGRTEREQIQALLDTRLAAIDKSTKAESEKEALRAKAHAAAKADIDEIVDAELKASAEIKEQAERDAQDVFASRQDRLTYLAEIEAAQARVAGRALEATRIELEAVKERYQAELDYINAIIAKKGESPELLAQQANAQAGLTTANADITTLNRDATREFDALTETGGSELEDELTRIDEIERAKMEKLEELRTEELEAVRNFEAKKTQIETEADAARQQARLASAQSQLSTTQNLLGGISSALKAAGKENSKAAKVAAKAQQIVALGQAVVHTAQGVSAALATGNIPKAILVGALGAIQIGIIASQTFDGGGHTGGGARVGGVDGKGGRYAIVHPNESIVDHTKPGREVGGKSIAEAFGMGNDGMSALAPRGSGGISKAAQARAVSQQNIYQSFKIEGVDTQRAFEYADKKGREAQAKSIKAVEKRTFDRQQRGIG